MGVLIDTSVLVAIERRALTTDVLTEDGAISVVTVSELLQGVYRGDAARRAVRRSWITRTLDAFRVVDITLDVAYVHAEVGSALAASGLRVGEPDLRIGATAIAHGLGVLTRNAREFGRIPGLRVVAV